MATPEVNVNVRQSDSEAKNIWDGMHGIAGPGLEAGTYLHAGRWRLRLKHTFVLINPHVGKPTNEITRAW